MELVTAVGRVRKADKIIGREICVLANVPELSHKVRESVVCLAAVEMLCVFGPDDGAELSKDSDGTSQHF